MRRAIIFLAFFLLLGSSCNCINSGYQKIGATYQSDTYADALTEHRYKVTVRLEKFCPSGLFFYGTGVIVSSEYVLTARHVVECPGGVESLYVVGHRSDGKRVKLKTYWKHGHLDIAILKAESWWGAMKGDGKVDLGEHASVDRRRLKVGDWLCYVGGGGRIEVVLTKCGEVYESGSNEFAVGLHVFGGNSGGPLFNSEGKLVGIIYGKRDEDLEGYAVPIAVLPEVLPEPAKKTGAKTK